MKENPTHLWIKKFLFWYIGSTKPGDPNAKYSNQSFIKTKVQESYQQGTTSLESTVKALESHAKNLEKKNIDLANHISHLNTQVELSLKQVVAGNAKIVELSSLLSDVNRSKSKKEVTDLLLDHFKKNGT